MFLRDELVLSADRVVADIGSGTGLLTQILLEMGNQVHAVEPNRASGNHVPIYANEAGLSVERPSESAKPLFYAVSKSEGAGDNSAIVSLYEYRHTETDQHLYSIDPALRQRVWIRTAQPLCQVWKAPPGTLLWDSEAKPFNP